MSKTVTDRGQRERSSPAGSHDRMPWSVWLARLGLLVAVAGTTAMMWSDAMARWWSSDEEASGSSPIPAVVRRVAHARPDLGDADIHALLWSISALLATFAVCSLRSRVALIAGVWGWTLFVEIAQPWMSATRGRQWGDAGGNTVGILIGSLLGLWIIRRRGRRRTATRPRSLS